MSDYLGNLIRRTLDDGSAVRPQVDPWAENSLADITTEGATVGRFFPGDSVAGVHDLETESWIESNSNQDSQAAIPRLSSTSDSDSSLASREVESDTGQNLPRKLNRVRLDSAAQSVAGRLPSDSPLTNSDVPPLGPSDQAIGVDAAGNSELQDARSLPSSNPSGDDVFVKTRNEDQDARRQPDSPISAYDETGAVKPNRKTAHQRESPMETHALKVTPADRTSPVSALGHHDQAFSMPAEDKVARQIVDGGSKASNIDSQNDSPPRSDQRANNEPAPAGFESPMQPAGVSSEAAFARESQSSAASQPVVHVTIGRVDIRATVSGNKRGRIAGEPPAVSRSTSRQSVGQSLDGYLRRPHGGRP